MSRANDDSTVRSTGSGRNVRRRSAPVPALTVVWHPNLERIGELCALPDLAPEGSQIVTRVTPSFAQPGATDARPLEDSRLSRTSPALTISKNARGFVELHPGPGDVVAEVHGTPLREPMTIMPAELDLGLIILIARRVVLCLHRVQLPVLREDALGLVGGSDRMERVRRIVRRVAATEVPVLVRGETGTGKELVAKALAQAGPRAGGPFIAINMAAIPGGTAAAEFFGHEKGAFTGASAARRGYFGEAAGGTLFLDEVGLTPPELQPLLLRVLESGELLPLGGARPRRTDVRVLAATDADLEGAIAARSFSAPLFQRLAGFQIALPPLRQRREDFGPLLLHFLKSERSCIPELESDIGASRQPWLRAAQVAHLATGSWPGNVRALRNAVRQLVIAGRGEEQAVIDEEVERLMDGPAGQQLSSVDERQTRPPVRVAALSTTSDPVRAAEIEPDAFMEALRRNGWSPSATATDLGIPRTTVHALIDRHPGIRKPTNISPAELRREFHACGGDVNLMANRLRVSVRGLRLRLSQLFQRASVHGEHQGRRGNDLGADAPED